MRKMLIAIAALLLVAFQTHAEPIKVLKSEVKPTFSSDVMDYAQELAEWKAHMARAAADKAAGVPKEKAFSPYPAPIADPAVMSAVGADGKPNYEIVNDDPNPDQVLADKKMKLITEVRLAEGKIIDSIFPVGKRRAYGFRLNDVAAADQARTAANLAAQQEGTLTKVGEFLGIVGSKKDPGKAAADAISQRPKEDVKFMAEHEARQARISAIEHAAAQMESDIDDLTSGNIDSWVMPAFPN